MKAQHDAETTIPPAKPAQRKRFAALAAVLKEHEAIVQQLLECNEADYDAEPVTCACCGRKVSAPHDFGFSLRLNFCASNDPCVICGRRTDALTGLELFYVTGPDHPGLVCDTCGRRFAPKLYWLRGAADLQDGDEITF